MILRSCIYSFEKNIKLYYMSIVMGGIGLVCSGGRNPFVRIGEPATECQKPDRSCKLRKNTGRWTPILTLVIQLPSSILFQKKIQRCSKKNSAINNNIEVLWQVRALPIVSIFQNVCCHQSEEKTLQSSPAQSFVLVDYSQLVVAQQHPFKPFVNQHDSMREESRCELALAKRLEIDSVLND